MKYIVEIKTPNRIFSINGKLTRSPFRAIIHESELSKIKAKIHSDGVADYTINEYDNSNITKNKETKIAKRATDKKVKKDSTIDKDSVLATFE